MAKNNVPSQKEAVFRFILDNGSITDFQAFAYLGIRRLSARIYNLRAEGIPIITEIVRIKNRDGKYIGVAKYRFPDESDFAKETEDGRT